MKYAFIIGSNAFIVPHGAVVYNNNGDERNFLSIRSVYRDKQEGSVLVIDADIADTHGKKLTIDGNQIVRNEGFNVTFNRDMIQALQSDGHILFDVHQLDEDAAMGLEPFIVQELDRQDEVAVIRIRGDFMLGDTEIKAENEKLFVNDNSYATSAQIGHGHLAITPEGVVL